MAQPEGGLCYAARPVAAPGVAPMGSAETAMAAPQVAGVAGLVWALACVSSVSPPPDLFPTLRGLIDAGRRRGHRAGRFLLLGSASGELLRQTSESLAGRIAYVELAPFDVLEIGTAVRENLWVRGGFPDSLLVDSDRASARWRANFIRTYLERDIPLLGPRVPAETLRRFWTMLAHTQGGLLNAAALGRGLAVDGKTIVRYVDLLVDLLLVRPLPRRHANVGKRLVKAPKLYIRDSGIVHSLLGLDDREAVLGHPAAGGSWEGFVIENLLRVAPERTGASFYRTAAGAEVDLVLELPRGELWTIEVQRSTAPRLEKGFHHARTDLHPTRACIVYGGDERYPLAADVEAVPLADLCRDLATRA